MWDLFLLTFEALIFHVSHKLNQEYVLFDLLKLETRERNYPKIIDLLENDPTLIDAQDDNGNTPLHLAIFDNDKYLVLFFCLWRPDFTVPNNLGRITKTLGLKFNLSTLELLCQDLLPSTRIELAYKLVTKSKLLALGRSLIKEKNCFY
jgi:ankyrin repeat protein